MDPRVVVWVMAGCGSSQRWLLLLGAVGCLDLSTSIDGTAAAAVEEAVNAAVVSQQRVQQHQLYARARRLMYMYWLGSLRMNEGLCRAPCARLLSFSGCLTH